MRTPNLKTALRLIDIDISNMHQKPGRVCCFAPDAIREMYFIASGSVLFHVPTRIEEELYFRMSSNHENRITLVIPYLPLF